MFLKERRDGTIKGQASYGSSKSDATSPTVSNAALLIMSTIDNLEGRDMVIVDVHWAFLKTAMDEEVYMCIRGRLAELMVQTAPEIYQKYITVNSDNMPLIFVKLQNSLCGCLRSALLFYLKLVEYLESNGFNMNTYDPCMADTIINEKQFTITWHVACGTWTT
jgi:hypothetical protein